MKEMTVHSMIALTLGLGVWIACTGDSISRSEAKHLLQTAIQKSKEGATVSIPAGRFYISRRLEAGRYVSPSPDEKCADILQDGRELANTGYVFSDRMDWSLLESSGLVILNRGSDGSREFCDIGISGRFQDALVNAKIVRGEQSFPLLVTSCKITEVTGVSAPATDAVGRRTSFVEYRCAEVVTAAGEVLINAGFVDRPDLGTHEGQATLVLFDDGWRVERVD
jgi:hypothetical protein